MVKRLQPRSLQKGIVGHTRYSIDGFKGQFLQGLQRLGLCRAQHTVVDDACEIQYW